MANLILVHWSEVEAREKGRTLAALGHEAAILSGDGNQVLAAVKKAPPAALLIDLSRSPAQGRDVAVALRIFKGTRMVPLIFVGGKEEKVVRIKEVIPDARFTGWEDVGVAVEDALLRPPGDPVVPDSGLAGYSGTPLPKKLGIKEGSSVLLVRPPKGFPESLKDLPAGVRFRSRYSEGVDLILWFVDRERALARDIQRWASRVGEGGMWILWPKKSSGVKSDLNQAVVRRAGLANGLVDYKIAAVDETWSGLKFSVRKKAG